MRIFVSASVILLASALALPSVACDRHGGGGFYGQFHGAGWSDYTPPLSESDISLPEDEFSEWEKRNVVPPAAPKPKSKKPTFSKASSRASIAAKSRLAALAKSAKSDKKVKTTEVSTESPFASRILNTGR